MSAGSNRAAEGRAGERDVAPEIEARLDGVRVVRHAEWSDRFPWLVQGLTLRELDFSPLDTRSPPWDRLLRATGVSRVARVRQVHGSRVLRAREVPGADAERPEGDALAADAPDVLLAITVADCVPVFLIEPRRRVLGLAHAGWRGAAAGVVEAVIERMEAELGASRADLHAHLGPAICGVCYEIGPEVAAAFGLGTAVRRLDLRERIAARLEGMDIPDVRVTRSRLCTRCDGDRLLSYRGGDRTARMCAFLGAAAS